MTEYYLFSAKSGLFRLTQGLLDMFVLFFLLNLPHVSYVFVVAKIRIMFYKTSVFVNMNLTYKYSALFSGQSCDSSSALGFSVRCVKEVN